MLRNALFQRLAPGPVALVLAVAACAEHAPTPPALSPAEAPRRTSGESPTSGTKVCKDGPAGTYHFQATATGGLLYWDSFSLEAGSCVWIWEGIATTPLTTVTVTEVSLPTGTEVGSIYVQTDFGRSETLTGTNTVSLEVDGTHSGKVVVTNVSVPPPPPPSGSQGCTPGYWKQTQHFDSWTVTGYDPGMLLGPLFPGTGAYKVFKQNSYTLLDALSFPDDVANSIDGAAQLLSRAAVAAVLNAAHPNVAYPRTVAKIRSEVDAALATKSRTTILGLQQSLDADNNSGCPLS